mmetsp:Transcript_28398/g.48731  ORF Transcript_28398/g.48731 Transcript_28398/m.48731 type:complete len:238 (-) Transcript_28398:596-1309(-)
MITYTNIGTHSSVRFSFFFNIHQACGKAVHARKDHYLHHRAAAGVSNCLQTRFINPVTGLQCHGIEDFAHFLVVLVHGRQESGKIQLGVWVGIFLATINDGAEPADLVERELVGVHHVDLLDQHAELAQPMHRLGIRQPAVVLVHLPGLAAQVVQHVHVQLQLAVDVVPVLHDAVLVRAQPHHHPHRQRAQRLHRCDDVAIAGLAVRGDDHTRLLAGSPELTFHGTNLVRHFANVAT